MAKLKISDDKKRAEAQRRAGATALQASFQKSQSRSNQLKDRQNVASSQQPQKQNTSAVADRVRSLQDIAASNKDRKASELGVRTGQQARNELSSFNGRLPSEGFRQFTAGVPTSSIGTDVGRTFLRQQEQSYFEPNLTHQIELAPQVSLSAKQDIARRLGGTDLFSKPAGISPESPDITSVSDDTSFSMGSAPVFKGGQFVSHPSSAPLGRSLGTIFSTDVFRYGGQGAKNLSNQLLGEGQDAPASLGRGQTILNQAGRDAKVKEERQGPVEQQFLNQFGILRPSPIYSEDGRVIGLNNRTTVPAIDNAYLRFFKAKDINQRGIAAEFLRSEMEAILGNTSIGNVFLDKLNAEGVVRGQQLTQDDINLMGAISGGSDVGETRQAGLGLDIEGYLARQKANQNAQYDSFQESIDEQRVANNKELSTEIAKLDKEMLKQIEIVLTREGFTGGTGHDLTKSQRSRMANLEREVREEFEDRKADLVSQNNSRNAQLNIQLREARAKADDAIFNLENQLFGKQYDTAESQAQQQAQFQQQTALKELELEQEIEQGNIQFARQQQIKLQDLKDDIYKEQAKALIKQQADQMFTRKDLLDYLTKLDQIDDPAIRSEAILSTEQAMADSGFNVSLDTLYASVFNAEELRNINNRLKQSQIHRNYKTGDLTDSILAKASSVGLDVTNYGSESGLSPLNTEEAAINSLIDSIGNVENDID